MNDQRDLEAIIRSRFPVVVVETLEERRFLDLLREVCTRNEWPFFTWDVVDGLARADRFGRDIVAGTHAPEALLRHLAAEPQNGVFALLDFVEHLDREPVRQRAVKRIVQEATARGRTLVLVGHRIELSPDLRRMSATFALSVPGPGEVRGMLAEEIEAWHRESGERVQGSREAAELMVRHLAGLAQEDVRRLIRQSIRRDGAITMDDVERIQKAKYDMLDGAGLLAMEMEIGRLADVGGFAALKRWLELRRAAFLGDAERLGLGMPKGVLLLGVQGGGKSLAAKCVAGAWQVPLLRLDFGVLYNKFFGETERNTRAALEAADTMAPCVLWIDEIEKGLSSAGDSLDGGVSRRVLGTLLTWMAERESRVFMVATANDIASLPPELMRKGRFDEIFFVDLPDAATRAEIFRIHLERRRMSASDFDLAALAAASEGFSGAEIEQAIVSALYGAYDEKRALATAHVLGELAATRPLSVVMAERVEALRRWAAGRAVPAG